MAYSSPPKRPRRSTPPPHPRLIPLLSHSPPLAPPSIPAHQPSSPTKKAKTKPKPPSPPPPAASDEESDEIEDFSSDDDRDAREPSPTPTPAPLLVRKSAKAKGKEREVEKEALEEDSDEIQDPDSPPSTPAPPPAPKFRNSFGKKPIISSTPSKPFLKPPRQPPPALHTPTSLRSPNPPSSPSPTLPLLHPSSTPAPPSSGVTSFSDGRALRRIDTDSDGPWTPDPRCSEAQLEALEAVKKGENVFLTGPAGTGKSFLLHEIRAQLSHANKALFVTATTGIASLSIDGITLHSFAGIGLADKPVEQLVGRCRARRLANWKETDVLVVDEISMLHPDVFTKLSMIGKIIREDQRPFGGIQLIVCGDFFQLPPVPDEPSCFRCGKKSLTSLSAQSASLSPESPIDGVPLAKVKRCNAGGCGFAFRQREFAFETEAWAECDFTTIELTRVFRQDDPELISTLSRIRQGICTDADEKLITSGGSIVCEPFPSTKLYPLRKSVAKENKFEFDKIREKTVGFGARDVATGKHHVENLKTALSVEAHGRLVDFRAALSVELKIGAQVMLLFNLDPSAKLANGSLGKVVGWEKIPKLDYAVTSGTVGAHSWTIEIDREHHLARTQIPLQLAWALTIHKGQGQTIQRVRVHLPDTFEAGQAYVALSRATTLAGLRVLGFEKGFIKAHPKVKAFYRTINAGRPFRDPPAHPINPLDFCPVGGDLCPQLRHIFGKPSSTWQPPRSSPSSTAASTS